MRRRFDKERRHVFDGDASRFLTRLCIYRSGGKVGSKRLKLCNTSCNGIRTSFPVVLDGELAVLSSDQFQKMLCALLYVPLRFYSVIVLAQDGTVSFINSEEFSGVA